MTKKTVPNTTYSVPKFSKIKVSENFPVGSSSKWLGANVNAFAFNLDFIAQRDPNLAQSLLELADQAMDLFDKEPLAVDDPRFDIALERANRSSSDEQ